MNPSSPIHHVTSQPTLAGTESDASLPTMDELDDLQAQLDSIDRTLAELDEH